jgi:endoglucanase
MKKKIRCSHLALFLICLTQILNAQSLRHDSLLINESGYYETQGLNVMLFDDFYLEDHQGGLTIIENGTSVAANGDVRLEPTPGQWAPVPKSILNLNKYGTFWHFHIY